MKENENKEKELAKEKKEMQHNANHYKILHGGALKKLEKRDAEIQELKKV